MKAALSFLLILFNITNTHAQYATNRNKVWALGYKAGVDFNSGTLKPIITGYDNTTIQLSSFEVGGSAAEVAGRPSENGYGQLLLRQAVIFVSPILANH
jgi:hypothetical protein